MTYLSTGWRQVLTRNFCVFTMSVTASVLYYVSFLFTLFANASSLLGATMQNVCLMLLPGFCVLGAWSLMARIRLSRGGARAFWILLCVSFVCCAGYSVLYFLALWGANATITVAMRNRMLQKLKENGIDPNDRGDGPKNPR